MNRPAKAGAVSELYDYLWPEIRCGMRSRRVRNAYQLLAGLILLALPCAAQMQVGDNLQNESERKRRVHLRRRQQSRAVGHSMGFSGNGNLTGSYYSPNFLNFNVDPFYNRAQWQFGFREPDEYDRRYVRM